MLKYLKIVAISAVLMVLFTGCNEQVPAGYKGKILGVNGFQPELYPPSKVWLANNPWNINKEKLFLIQTTTQKYKERMTVLLRDKLSLSADVYFRGRIVNDDKILNKIFNDIPMNDNVVTTDEVYSIYAQMVVRNTTREVLSKYNVDEINKNYDRLSSELYNALKPKLKGLPIEISDITISNIQYPKIVTDAINKAKQRRMQIEEEQAKVQIALTKAKGREEVAKAEYKIKMLEAKRIRDYNKMIGEGVTNELLALRKLEVQEKMVDAIQANKNVVYMPMDMMTGTTNMRIIK